MAVIRSIFVLTLLAVLINAVLSQLDDDLAEENIHPSFKNKKFDRSHLPYADRERTNEFWWNLGKKFVRQQKQQKQNTNVAKNIIMFMGDGMGLTTLVATRSYINGENTKLAFEEFPYVGLSKTYCVDKIVCDSAATATACLCGVKANFGTVGVNAAISFDDCQGMKNSSNHVYSIAKWAMDKGKSAGFITTARITDASPAGVYANTANSDWESNHDVEQACGANHGVVDTAQQLIHGKVGSKLKLMMGGGKSKFIGKRFYGLGDRHSDRNLIQEYQKQSPKNVFVETKEQLEQLNFNQTERLLGIFSDDHMSYHLEAKANPNNTQPSLEEMTKKAIKFMQQQEDKGYFLFIESNGIDTSHHENKALLALDETKEFSQAVNVARQMTSEKDTLIVVTADHSNTFSTAGYQDRGSNIFSLVNKADDKIPYEPLSYANGEGFRKHFDVEASKRVNPKKVFTEGANNVFPATVPLGSSTHSGEDVAVFASGPWSHLFTGVYEQNAIPHMMAYAACLGEGLKACDVL